MSAEHEHFLRSKVANTFKAAGVLPFAVTASGQIVVLLGSERFVVKTGPGGKVKAPMWKDFGGQREAIDTDVEATASREFAEETLGLFGGCEVNERSVAMSTDLMAKQLRSRSQVLQVVHQLRKGQYHMFIAQTAYIDLLMFRLAAAQNEQTKAIAGAEKTSFAWCVSFKRSKTLDCPLLHKCMRMVELERVLLSDVLAAVGTCGKRYHMLTAAPLCMVRHGSPDIRRRRMQLHPCFATSLRMAQRGGLAALVAHAKALPLPKSPAVQRVPVREEYTEAASSSLRSSTHSSMELPSRDTTAEGITPAHMLYWISQEEVAVQLRIPCPSRHQQTPDLVQLAAAAKAWAKASEQLPGLSGRPHVQ